MRPANWPARWPPTLIALVYRKRLDQSPPEAILSAILDANHQIHSRGQASPDFRGMGTTATALVLLPAGAMVAHVGDSRAYRLRGAQIEQLTFDHSLVWEIRAAGQTPDAELPGYISKNIITRSLGPNAAVQVDLEGPHPVQAGDTFLLCSDGLSGQVKDDEIGMVLSCLPPAEAAQALVDLANLRGGPDNITVVIVRVLGPQIAQDASSDSSGRGRIGQCPARPIRRCGRSWAWRLWRPWECWPWDIRWWRWRRFSPPPRRWLWPWCSVTAGPTAAPRSSTGVSDAALT